MCKPVSVDVRCLVWLTGLSYPSIIGSHGSLPPVGRGAVGHLGPSGFLTVEPFFPFWSPGMFNPFSLLPKECSREEGSWEWVLLSTDLPKVRAGARLWPRQCALMECHWRNDQCPLRCATYSAIPEKQGQTSESNSFVQWFFRT